MQPSRATLIAIMIITLCAVTGAAWAARANIELNSLRGLGGVYLIVQAPSDEMAADGLSKDMIKAGVNKQFEKAGIKLLSDAKDLKDNDAIFLIALSSVKSKTGAYACSVDAQLIQITSLARDPKVMVPATTWTNGVVAIVDKDSLTKLREKITSLVDEFIKDYQSVNLPISGETKST
ncbi:MAG: hypothetical protein NT018_08105 [Armatimonadetes bacterium]|nr:hypothetical protein [Armatimonadota bacterium]